MSGTFAHCSPCLHTGLCQSQLRPPHLSCRTLQLPRQSCSLKRGWKCGCTPQLHKTRIIGRQCRADSSSSTDGKPAPRRPQYSIEAERAMESLQGTTTIGSEYGEGFVEFRIGAQPLHLDVDTLNERLKVQGANRMRHAMHPDEAYGMIFSMDNVIVDTRKLQYQAWQQVAKQEGLDLPSMQRQIYDIRPERAIMEVLQWTRDWGKAQQLAWEVANAFVQQCNEADQIKDGVKEWLQALASARVPCTLVSNMSRQTVNSLLKRLGLGQFFQAYVTAEDGMDTISQRFLSASIKLGRPPNQCVVFESSPAGITAAHNCTMKVVAVQGAHKGYHLQAADLTCSAMSELSVYNVRRLFANRGYEAMDLRQHIVGNTSDKPKKRRIGNAVID